MVSFLDTLFINIVVASDLKEQEAGIAHCDQAQRELTAQVVVDLARNLGTGREQLAFSAMEQARFGVAALLSEKIELWQDVIAHLPAEWPAHVVERVRRDLQRDIVELSRAPAPLTAARLDRALATRAKDLEARLGPITELWQLYGALARQFVWTGDTAKATQWLQHAISLDERAAKEWFFTEVVRESFTKAVAEESPTAPVVRDFANAVEVSVRVGMAWGNDQRTTAREYFSHLPPAIYKADPQLKRRVAIVTALLRKNK